MYNVFTVNSSSDWELPKKSCLINFSILKETRAAAPFRSFSVKYVSRGCERYQVNGINYNVKSGEYLLANHFAEGFVEIDKEVKGICIDVAPSLLSEVVSSYQMPDAEVCDPALDIFFNSPDFLENKYAVENTHVGKFLRLLDHQLSNNPQSGNAFTREFYFLLAENILHDHIPVFKQLQNVKGIKPATRKDLLRRLTRACDYMQACFMQQLQIADVAMQCGMSEYHFYRLFKEVFKQSPHQYIISLRMQRAKYLLCKGFYSVGDIAIATGFNDVFTFSKAFKKYFGKSPSAVAKCN